MSSWKHCTMFSPAYTLALSEFKALPEALLKRAKNTATYDNYRCVTHLHRRALQLDANILRPPILT